MAALFLLLFFIGVIWIALQFVSQYNELQNLRQSIAEAQSNIVVLLQKRVDLINQLAAVSYEFARLEVPVMISIGRNIADLSELQQTSAQLSSAFQRLMVLSQNYPALRSSERFEQLMSEETNVENQLQQRREDYNSQVRQYNTVRNRFPTMFLASALGFPEAAYWHSGTGAAAVQIPHYKAPGVPGAMDTGYSGLNPTSSLAHSAPTRQLPPPPSQPIGTHAWLEVVRGSTESPIVAIFDGLMIGRYGDIDVRLTDTQVSRRHAVIRLSGDACFLQDLNSANGTFVNGQKITATRLQDGDRIQIGDAELIFYRK